MHRAFVYMILASLALSSCGRLYEDDYRDNSPTSGRLKVYVDEGLYSHIRNQAFTFESQYAAAHVEVLPVSEAGAVKALLDDSCQAIVIQRGLNSNEAKLFASRTYYPKYSAVAFTGVAFIIAARSPLTDLDALRMEAALSGSADTDGSLDNAVFVIDRDNSSVMRYLKDSVLQGGNFGPDCRSMKSTPELLDYVSKNTNAVGILDFAWLSDRDDSLYKSYRNTIRFLGIRTKENGVVFPSQSSFKAGAYPYRRVVHVIRKAGEFSLAKGFESFVAGPKGQLTFLKQGLLPVRQAERRIEVNLNGGAE